ncbi:response regulator transcription factor [Sphaerotilus mobilis]|uniref:DNA-binding NarL/FixJ family response regulator n=1 Tax=Sphaerotilus mobilis TaxID=47994 RepID=A0A4Q7LPN4_9BURK|nr:response regulator transcription factor [Sphaerotilus mobilis]RZS56695.1 DNA-binding NarL/FixJ family response regulator [Sphaerotilus mobilis]
MSVPLPLRALVVEENAAARQFMVRVVRESFSDDIEFKEAGDLEAARQLLGLSACGSQRDPGCLGFDLVLCDLESADGDGLALLAQLSDDPSIKVATTLHSDDEHLFPALQCGARGYLLKEDRFEVLVEELQKIARGQPSLSPAMARRMLGFFREIAASDAPRPAGARDPVIDLLAERERDVLTLLSKGYAVKEIARQLGIAWFVVNDHIRTSWRKLVQASSPEAALRQARRTFND